MQEDVVIVGAGVSGLAAASVLHAAGTASFSVLEATDRTGGRIKQVHGMAPWPVELGPEFVHGANTSLAGLLETIGCTLREKEWPDYFYFADDRTLIPASEQVPDVKRVMDLFESVDSVPAPETDISARQWLVSQGAGRRMLAIADASFATDFGCTLDELGLRETIAEKQRWDAGDTYMLLDRSLQALVDHLAEPLQARIHLNWPVHKISHGPDGVVVHGPHGRRKRCKKVLVTASLAVLQSDIIAFQPRLPAAKRGALSRLRMSNAIKVILAFRRPFWPEKLFDVVCVDCFIPEFWVTSYPATDSCKTSSTGRHAMVGFVTGQRAVDASRLSVAQIVRRTLQQLDRMFESQQQPNPATEAFVKAHVADWSKEQYVRGCYSHPSLGALSDDRATLAAAVDNCVFFAGEATHEAVNPCLQAAFETGKRAARELVSTLAASKL